jgi:hypothetical protein
MRDGRVERQGESEQCLRRRGTEVPRKRQRPYIEDPEPAEETEEYLDEIMDTHYSMGTRPDQIMNLKSRELYLEWLKKNNFMAPE